ncbi:unnamed protein product [Adineta steineri]|uniref:Ammonium transporter AmtB-like domain-containing protein n=1 Tax=Adineta steineri TaxID=433720 RepID=A0A819C9I3_9BILA|nr:unnamed protein product [Adineta steineri]CAF0961593.1 unnamed protein product [Adineta steineri]CAF3649909.1 unnamed protein product [Adineta steineri]CAF3804174.1 unnamed protein product [Adineta steineri]
MALEDIREMATQWTRQYMFPIGLVVFQCGFIILYAFHADYGLAVEANGTTAYDVLSNVPPPRSNVEFYYSMFQDVHVMMFIGFGFLMTFLRRYSFSSVSFNFLVAAFVLEWAILIRGYVFDWDNVKNTFPVDVTSLLHADFVCAAILISFGAVLGKTNPAQLVVLALIEVVLQIWNEYIGTTYFCTFDAGESIFVHIFGAYFGLAASYALQRKRTVESEKESSSYASDIFSMIGTLFLFCFWPSFNAGTAFGDGRLRAITNTYISISASVILTFVVSALVGKGKEEIIHIQNATLAGGVAVGAIADKDIGLFGAMIIGSVAGTISTLGYKYLLELLKRINIHDTCGVHNLHGMPGVLSAIASIILTSIPSRSLYQENLTDKCLGGGLNRTVGMQAAYQIAGVVLTLGMGIIGGLGTGLFLRLPIFATPDNDSYFDDSLNWHVPKDFVAEDSALGTLMKNLMPNQMKLDETPEEQPQNANTIEVIQETSPRNLVGLMGKTMNQRPNQTQDEPLPNNLIGLMSKTINQNQTQEEPLPNNLIGLMGKTINQNSNQSQEEPLLPSNLIGLMGKTMNQKSNQSPEEPLPSNLIGLMRGTMNQNLNNINEEPAPEYSVDTVHNPGARRSYGQNHLPKRGSSPSIYIERL